MSAELVPLVLVHGQLMTDAVWHRFMPFMPPGSVHIADVSSDDSIAAMADRLLAVAPDRFDMIGFAMGGFVAFEVLRKAPERVRRLALVSTLAEADGPDQQARRQRYADLVKTGDFDRVVEQRIPALLGGLRRPDSDLTDMVRNMADDTGAATFLNQQAAIIERRDSVAGLRAIACPCAVVRGEQDAITTAGQFQTLVQAIPDARGVTIAACGHLVPLERPAMLASILREAFDT